MKSARFGETLRVLVHRTSENVHKLLGALRDLCAVYRNDPRDLTPTESHLMGPGHHLLSTISGDLDCLGSIDGQKAYVELVPFTTELASGPSERVRVLELSMLIEVKRRAGRPKDMAVIPFLEATLDEIRKTV